MRLVCRRIATKSSKSLWTSAMTTTDSGGSAGAFAGPTKASSAHTRTRRKKILARFRKTQIGARTTVLPHTVKQQKFSENIDLRRAPSIGVHHKLPSLTE